MIRALAVVDVGYEFGDDEVEVGIALSVTVGGQVDGHAVERGGKIGAVVEVEAAKEILVGFAGAAVLGDDEAGDGFKQFAGTKQGTAGELGRVHRAFGGRIGNAHEIFALT